MCTALADLIVLGFEEKTIQYLRNPCNISQSQKETFHDVNMNVQAVEFWLGALKKDDSL